MLFKLLKYELKATYKIFLLTWGVLFCFIIVSSGELAISGFSLFFIFSGLFFVPVYLGIRYRQSIYGSEGYFLMSVPTSAFTIVGAKVINGVIWLTGTILVMVSTIILSNYLFRVSIFTIMDVLNSLRSSTFSGQGVIMYANLVGAIVLLYFVIALSRIIPYRGLGTFVGALTFVVMAYGIQYGLGMLFLKNSLIFYQININYIGYLLSLFGIIGIIYMATALMIRKKLELV